MGIVHRFVHEASPALVSISFLDELFAECPIGGFQVRLWDGNIWGAKQDPRFTLVLKHPGALRAMFDSPTELGLGEAYIYDDFDIEGDIQAAVELSGFLVAQDLDLPHRFRLTTLLRRLPARERPRVARTTTLHGQPHSLPRSREAIAYHYDLPSDFYALWLDQRMVYSCAYFVKLEDDLNTAQLQKLDYICKKLRLRRGDRLLDIGCGWGSLVLHAAAQYGIQAVGITLSRPQAEYARERIHRAGLFDQCRIEVADYRELGGNSRYDKIVSVGMFEHVGQKFLPEYYKRAWDLLEPGGVFLNHGIAYSATYHRKGPSFIDHYVFPDSELVPVSANLRAAEASGFEVIDVESLRKHYALTLSHWLRRLETCSAEAHRLIDDITYRIWRIYLAGSAYGFRMGRLNVYQTLLAKSPQGENTLPLTRSGWYQS